MLALLLADVTERRGFIRAYLTNADAVIHHDLLTEDSRNAAKVLARTWLRAILADHPLPRA